MIRVEPTPEPATFDAECRQKGLAWLHGVPDEPDRENTLTRLALLSGTKEQRAMVKRPPSHWTQFEDDLRTAFHQRCAYCTVYIPSGDVDHYIPQSVNPALMYEWSNYRYADAQFNSTRKAILAPDPFQIQDNWFELTYPGMLLQITDLAPQCFGANYNELLAILNKNPFLRTRREWHKQYLDKKLTLAGLDDMAPMIAQAIRRHETTYGSLGG